jgi:hypothetical protein
VVVSTSDAFDFDLTENIVMMAQFDQGDWVFTAIPSPAGLGTIDGATNGACPNNYTVNVTAKPAADCEFVKWTDT